MITRRITAALLTLFVLALLSVSQVVIQAQTGDAACPALVERALTQVGSNCSNLERNSACYGFNQVQATFAQTVAADFFTRPADVAELAAVQTIRTSPLDLAQNAWGIAVMNVQANVPDTLPGQAVTVLLLGDTEIENAVDPATGSLAFPTTVITQTATELRSASDPASAIISALPPGTVLDANGISPDGFAVRVQVNNATGWVNRSAINQIAALNSLPVISGSALSPMQAFYFRNGPGQSACRQTPSLLSVRSPENITVDLTANGANIRLGSLITLRTLNGGDLMQLTVIEGRAILEPETPQQTIVEQGFTTTRCLNPAENLGIDGQQNDQRVGRSCAWTPPQPATLEQLEEGQTAQALHERLDLAQIIPTATPPPPECPVGQTIIHTVATGENLFRISLRYNTSMGAIMAANGLTDPQLIFIGQRLTIPCGVDTGIPSVPDPQPGGSIPTVTPGGLDCSGFRATSPLDGFRYGLNTFYWDPAPGATSYQVNVYGVDERSGALVGAFSTGGGSTSLSADLTVETIGFGFSFAWEVQALVNGQVVCTTPRVTIPREPPPPGPAPVCTPVVICPTPPPCSVHFCPTPEPCYTVPGC